MINATAANTANSVALKRAFATEADIKPSIVVTSAIGCCGSFVAADGSVVTWRRAQMVLLSAQAMDVAMIAQVTFTSEDRVRDVLHNFNLDGFDSLYPRYGGGRPPVFTLAQRREVKRAALSRPIDHDLPFSTWSLAKLAGLPGR